MAGAKPDAGLRAAGFVMARWIGFNFAEYRTAVDKSHSVCTIHTMTSAELIRRMEKAGWVLRGAKGSHHVYTHPQRPGHVSVPHPKKDLGVGLLRKLMQQTGLK